MILHIYHPHAGEKEFFKDQELDNKTGIYCAFAINYCVRACVCVYVHPPSRPHLSGSRIPGNRSTVLC